MSDEKKVRVGRFIGHFSRHGVTDEKSASHFVYFIGDGEFVKIGKSTGTPLQRLNALQTGNARALNLLFAIPVLNSECAYNLESAFHKAYGDFRISGEWFDILPLISEENLRDDFGICNVVSYERKPEKPDVTAAPDEPTGAAETETDAPQGEAEFLTIRQAAKRSGVPEYLIRRMVKRKECPGFYSGNRFYIHFQKFLTALKAR